MKRGTAMVLAAMGGASLGAFALALVRLGNVQPKTMSYVLLGTGALGSAFFDGKLRAASLGMLAAGAGQYTSAQLEEAYAAAVRRKTSQLVAGWLDAKREN